MLMYLLPEPSMPNQSLVACQVVYQVHSRFARCVGAPFSFFRFELLLESFAGLIVSLAVFLSAGDVALMVNSACARVFRDRSRCVELSDVSGVCALRGCPKDPLSSSTKYEGARLLLTCALEPLLSFVLLLQ